MKAARLAKVAASVFLAAVTVVATAYLLLQQSRPVHIVDIHQDSHFSHILVTHLPLTDRGKIAWWLRNRQAIQQKYHIPIPDHDGSYSIMIWIFGEGYKQEDDQDRFCFEDMKTSFRCIEKNGPIYINNSRNRGLIIETDGRDYRIEADQSSTRLQDA